MSTITSQRGNGSEKTRPLRLDPPGRLQRRPRMSWIGLGALLLVAFGLFGAITIARVADREPVLALAQPIERGEELTAAHLTTVRVGTDDDVSVAPAMEADGIVGLRATSDLSPGTLVTLDHFTAGPSVDPGESVIGLALAPGEYPTANLHAGDAVVVVRTPAPNGLDREEAAEAIVLAEAEVFAVEPLSDTARTLMVSLTVPSESAPEIAAAAAEGRIRLALVDGS